MTKEKIFLEAAEKSRVLALVTQLLTAVVNTHDDILSEALTEQLQDYLASNNYYHRKWEGALFHNERTLFAFWKNQEQHK